MEGKYVYIDKKRIRVWVDYEFDAYCVKGDCTEDQALRAIHRYEKKTWPYLSDEELFHFDLTKVEYKKEDGWNKNYAGWLGYF